MPWLAANRPLNDKVKILVHPNSGCQYNDLQHFSMWAGPSEALFTDILKGCVWAGCEDQVSGCIGFNHMTKSEGYGTCYQAPKAMNLKCTMTISPTSNVSTEVCQKPTDATMLV